MLKKIFIFCSFYFALINIANSQNYNIDEYLKQIEKGNFEEPKKARDRLINLYPNDPSIIFLDAVLTEDGEEAMKKYELIYTKYPNSKYADAALFRAYCYKYALGLYIGASKLYEQLKRNYPNSPYLKTQLRTFAQIENNQIQNQSSLEQKDTDTVKEIVNKPSASNNDEPKFTIQLGAFLKKLNAENLSKKLKESGYEVFTGQKKVAGADLTVVYYGKFKTREEASKALSQIEKDLNIVGRVTIIEK